VPERLRASVARVGYSNGKSHARGFMSHAEKLYRPGAQEGRDLWQVRRAV
jgi:hypothetical protein